MAATSIGTAWLQIKPSMTGISSEIQKSLGDGGSQASKQFGDNFKSNFLASAKSSFGEVFSEFGKRSDEAWSSFKSASATAIASIGAVGVAGITYAVKQFAEYEQLVGGVETLFKNNADQVRIFADSSYKTTQLSANKYMETITGFSASLLQGLKGDTKKAAEIGNMAVTDMADNANKMGTSMESITYAYQGFAKQNYTMLDNLKLGYGGTQSEMKRLLADASKLPAALGKKFDISNFGDVIQAIHLVQDNLGITGTSAKEASTTISGSFATARAAFDDMMVSLADPYGDFSGQLQKFLDASKQFLVNLAPVLKGIADQAFWEIEKRFPELGKLLSNTGDAIGKVFDWIKNNKETVLIIVEMVAGFKALQIATGAVRSVISTLSPYAKVVKGLGQGVIGLAQKMGILGGSGKKAKEAADGINSISNAQKSAPKSFSFGDSVVSFFENIGKSVKSVVGVVSDAVKQIAGGIMDVVVTIMKGAGEAIAAFFTALASPAVAIGAVMFTAVAASIAAAILLIGGAIGIVTPAMANFMNSVVIPFGNFLLGVFLIALNSVTDAIINLTNNAAIPLGNFLVNSFLGIINGITDAIIRLSQGAIMPIISLLAGSFISILRTVGDVLNSVVKTALDGISGVIRTVGDAFTKMGSAIKTALDGVSGVLQAFKDIIMAIGNAIIATVALATGRSIKYGAGFATVTSGHAYGGYITGAGSDRSDNIFSPVSPGEYVVQAPSVRALGGASTFDNFINRGVLPNQAEQKSGGDVILQFGSGSIVVNGSNNPEETASMVSEKIALKVKEIMN